MTENFCQENPISVKRLKNLSRGVQSSHDTWREEDIEFATDPNFFEQIFYVLTIVQGVFFQRDEEMRLLTGVF